MNNIVIQFVGIILFTGQMVSTQRTTLATARTSVLTATRYEVTAIAPVVPSGVEPHKAMILFQGTSVTATNWRVRGPLHSGWSYVELSNAARVEFIADAANTPVGPQLDSVSLPKLSGANPLKDAYQAPSYSGAAAVFILANGTLKTCKSGKRIDSTLTLNVKKQLTIRSGKQTLVLPADAKVVVANIPWAYADDQKTFSETGTTHSMTYCEMLGDMDCSMTPVNVTDSCNYFLPPPKPKYAEETMGTDFACSNTQWP